MRHAECILAEFAGNADEALFVTAVER